MIVKCYTQKIQANKTKPSILYEDAYIFVKKQRRKVMNYKERSSNVLIIGMDTMSRARIIKTMPKMVKRLQAQGWLDYRGYQKVCYVITSLPTRPLGTRYLVIPS